MSTIERLWRTYSDGKFGYAVQAKAFESKKVDKDFDKFFERIGWKNKEGSLLRWLPEVKADEFIYDLDKAPKGHLPLTSALRGTQLLKNLLSHPAWEEEGERKRARKEQEGDEMRRGAGGTPTRAQPCTGGGGHATAAACHLSSWHTALKSAGGIASSRLRAPPPLPLQSSRTFPFRCNGMSWHAIPKSLGSRPRRWRGAPFVVCRCGVGGGVRACGIAVYVRRDVRVRERPGPGQGARSSRYWVRGVGSCGVSTEAGAWGLIADMHLHVAATPSTRPDGGRGPRGMRSRPERGRYRTWLMNPRPKAHFS